MSAAKIIAIMIWILAGVFWLYGLISTLRSPVPTFPLPSMPLEASPILIIPFIFFVAARVLSPGLSSNTTARRGLLADIERNLHGQVLFGVFCIMFGALNLIQAFRAGKLLDSYISYGFFFSGGLGIVVGQLIWARRALPRPGSEQPDTEDRGLLGSIRRLRATNVTAFLTGMWTLLGMEGTGVLLSRLDLDQSIGVGLVLAVALLIFFLLPTLIFVVGIQNSDLGKPVFSTARLNRQRIVGRRMTCWFFGAMVAGLSFATFAALSRRFVQ